MVAENDSEPAPARIRIVITTVPEEQEAAEQTARHHGATLTDALSWCLHLLALAKLLPRDTEAALVKLLFELGFPQRKDPPCR